MALSGKIKNRMRMCKSGEIAMAIVREAGASEIKAALLASECPAQFVSNLPADWELQDARDALGDQVAPTPEPQPVDMKLQMIDSAMTVAQFAVCGEAGEAKKIMIELWGEKRTRQILSDAKRLLMIAVDALTSLET
jgi:hypothetical protein